MSNNLGLPQVTASTSDKDDFLNDVFDLVDSSVTSAVAVDGSVNAAVAASAVQNYLKITATNVPKAGTTLTLPQLQRMFILKNDKASLGPVTFQLGTASITIPVGLSCIAHMDGTANGLEVVSSAGGAAATTLAALTDIDVTTAPADGQVLTFVGSEGKWKPETPAVSSGGSGGSSGGTVATAYRQARYWRIADLWNNVQYAGTGTLQWLDKNGNAIPIAAYYSNGDDTDPIANAFDTDLTTYWTTRDVDRGFLACDLGANAEPHSVVISSRNGRTDCNIVQMNVECSDDKAVWKLTGKYFLTWSGQDSQVQTLPIAPATVAASIAGGSGSTLEVAYVKPPVAATWEQRNFQSWTHLVDYAGPGGGVMLYEDQGQNTNYGNVNNLRYADIPIPDPHWQVTARFRRHAQAVTFGCYGIVVRDNAGGKAKVMGMSPTHNGWGALNMNNDNGYSGDNGFGDNGGANPAKPDWWMRITWDGTTGLIWSSQDGYYWSKFAYFADNAAKFGFLDNAATHVGFGGSINNADSNIVAFDLTCLSWEYKALA